MLDCSQTFINLLDFEFISIHSCLLCRSFVGKLEYFTLSFNKTSSCPFPFCHHTICLVIYVSYLGLL